MWTASPEGKAPLIRHGAKSSAPRDEGGRVPWDTGAQCPAPDMRAEKVLHIALHLGRMRRRAWRALMHHVHTVSSASDKWQIQAQPPSAPTNLGTSYHDRAAAVA